MSLTTVTLALDDKLRSLRSASFDSNQKIETDLKYAEMGSNKSQTLGQIIKNTSTNTTAIRNRNSDRSSIMCNETIRYTNDSPERLSQINRAKPLRVQTYNLPSSSCSSSATRLYSQSSTSPNTSPNDILSSSRSHSSAENIVKVVNLPVSKTPSTVSSTDTDTSTTSNPMNSICSSTVRIDREMIREMNRILTTLERKATKLNRSLSLNYKNHKSECCCNGNGVTSNQNNSTHRTPLSNNRISLTKDEKTDKNINKRRQIQDGKNRRYTNRSIKRRHTVGGTHDYGSHNFELRCQQGDHSENYLDEIRAQDSPKDNHVHTELKKKTPNE